MLFIRRNHCEIAIDLQTFTVLPSTFNEWYVISVFLNQQIAHYKLHINTFWFLDYDSFVNGLIGDALH